jgi:predicted Zn-dependent protease
LIPFLLYFAGCSTATTSVKPKSLIGKKVFENEDMMIFKALEFTRKAQYDKAVDEYVKLYEKSGKKIYLLEAMKIRLSTRDYKGLEELVKSAPKSLQNSPEVLKYKITIELYKLNYKKAKELGQKLLKVQKNERNLQIVANIYLITKEYDEAYKYLQSAYKISNSKEVLLKIVAIDYNYLDKKKEALALLETHSRLYGCSSEICSRLVEIYGANQNIEGLIHTYEELYKIHPNDELAKKIVDLYAYKRDFKGAENFLKRNALYNDMLLDIYASQKEFKKAIDLANELYSQSGKVSYKLKAAIYKYEMLKDKDKKSLESVIKEFESAIDKSDNPLFLNYYGYILIDHDIDVKKGIKYVKEALKKEPDSPYYLDSLAWGLYKINECKEAKEIMQRVLDMMKEKEVIEHMNEIKKCLGESK